MLSTFILNFLIGVFAGTLLETIYRSKEAKRLIRPRLTNVLMYGLVGIFLALLYFSKVSFVLELVLLFVIPTLIEFTVGYFYLKIKGIRLWDYSGESFNFMGIIRLRFSLYWFLISMVYYYLLMSFISV